MEKGGEVQPEDEEKKEGREKVCEPLALSGNDARGARCTARTVSLLTSRVKPPCSRNTGISSERSGWLFPIVGQLRHLTAQQR